MLLDFDDLRHGGLQNPDVAIQQTPQRACNHSRSQVGSKTENNHTDGRTDQAHDQDGLATNLVTHPAPEHPSRELSESEGRGNHAGIEGNLAIVICHVEGLNHVIDIRENRHECNWFTDATECWQWLVFL